MLTLSERSRPIVATLPVVGDNIEEIAERFYRHLFGGTRNSSTGCSTAATRPKAPSGGRSRDRSPCSPAHW